MSINIITTIVILGIIVLLLMIFILKSILSSGKNSNIEKNIASGKYAKAIKQIKRLMEKEPNNSDIRYLLGKAYLADNRPELALAEFKNINKRALFSSPAKEIEFRNSIADLYLRFQHDDEALKEYILLINLDPKNAKNYFKAGNLYENSGKPELAVNYYEKAIELNSKYTEAHASLGLLLFKAGRTQDAEASISTALKLDPSNNMTLYCQGRIFRTKKDYARALAAFEKAARSQELRTKCFLERGCCYLEAQSFEKAIFEFSRAVRASKTPSSAETLYSRYLLAECHEKKREIDKAIEQWKIIKSIQPKFRDVSAKLQEYQDLQSNDHMKEYLTLGSDAFLKFCKIITEQYFHFAVQNAKEIKIGCSIFATETDSEKWLNARKKPQIMVFSRDSETVIEEDFLRSIHDQMKKKSVVTAYIITSSSFSKQAVSFAQNRPLELIDRAKLEKILEKVDFNF